jgi:lipopolysaccharide transport system ATP-binding protein
MKDVATGGRTVLFVSHNMLAVRSLCQKGLILENGKVKAYGSAQDAVAVYAKTNKASDKKEFRPSETSPSITSVRIDKDDLLKGVLSVTVGFSSPFPLRPPVPGIVVATAFGIPVFGSNPRFHSEGYDLKKSMKEGEIKFEVQNLPIYGGSYTLSVWLGDWETDYDQKRDALSFEWKAGEKKLQIPNTENIGYIDYPGKWTCK